MDIINIVLIGIDKEPKFKKINGERDPIIHLQGYEYIMELKCGINDQLKAKYFPMSFTGEARKWFYNLELISIISF